MARTRMQYIPIQKRWGRLKKFYESDEARAVWFPRMQLYAKSRNWNFSPDRDRAPPSDTNFCALGIDVSECWELAGNQPDTAFLKPGELYFDDDECDTSNDLVDTEDQNQTKHQPEKTQDGPNVDNN